MNFKRMMNIWGKMFFGFFIRLIYSIKNFLKTQNIFILKTKVGF